MKKTVALILTLAMLLGLAIPVTAEDRIEHEEPLLVYTFSTAADYDRITNHAWAYGPGHWGDIKYSEDVFNNTTASIKARGGQGWDGGFAVFPGVIASYGVYKASVWAYAPDGNIPFTMGFDTDPYTGSAFVQFTATDSWTLFEAEFNINFEFSKGSVFQIGEFYGSSSSFAYFDDIRIYEISKPAPSPTPIPTVAPTATPTPSPVVFEGENLLVNGDFSQGSHGWEDWWEITIDANGFAPGINSARTGYTYWCIQQHVYLESGIVYGVNYWTRTVLSPDRDQDNGSYFAVGVPSGDRDFGALAIKQGVVSDDWVLHSNEFTVPESGVYRLAFWGLNSYVYVADVKVVNLREYIAPTPVPHKSAFDCRFDNGQWWGWNAVNDYSTFFRTAPSFRINANGAWSAGMTNEAVVNAVYPNTAYKLAAYTYAPGIPVSFDFGMVYRFFENGPETHNQIEVTANNEWQYIEHIFTMPEFFATARLYGVSARSNATTFYLSDMNLYELKPESVWLRTMPEKTVYNTGQRLDLSGMTIHINYVDEDYSATIPVVYGGYGVEVTGFDRLTPGIQTVGISYMGIEVLTFDIEVLDGGDEVLGIFQYTHAKKTHYWLGEQFNFEGTKFFMSYLNGDNDTIVATGDMIDSSAFNPDVTGTYPIHVNYRGYSYSYNVKVSAKNHFTTTADGRILDPNGDDFIGIGANVNGTAMWGARNGRASASVLQDVDIIADTWNFNIVRAVSTFYLGHPDVTNRFWHYDDMDAIVKAFSDKGVVVKIEMHDYTGGYPLFTPGTVSPGGEYRYLSLYEFTDAWVDLALKYKDNPFVWINIMNEPSQGSGTSAVGNWAGIWRDYFRETYGKTYPGTGYDYQLDADIYYYVHDYIINALREAGVENLIVLDENHFGQSNYNPSNPDGPGSAVLHNAPKLNAKYNNLVYSLHPYGWSNLDYMISYAEHMKERGIAWMIGEFGAIWGDLGTHNSTMNVMTVSLMYGIGYTYWDWSNDQMSIVNRNYPGVVGGWGYEINRLDGTKPTNLSWFGSVIWDHSHGLLGLPVYRFVFPIVVNGDFEDGTTNPWSYWGGQMQWMPSGSYNGSAYARLRQGHGYTGTDIDHMVLIPGATYKLSVWGRLGASAGNVDFGIAYTAEDVPGEPHHFIYFNETSWTYKEITFTLPMSTITSARLFAWRPDNLAALTHFDFDDVAIELVSLPDVPCKDCDKCSICGLCICDDSSCGCARCEGHESAYTINVGEETIGGAGVTRSISVECPAGKNLDGKVLVVRVSNGSGEGTRLMVMTINARPDASVSYPLSGSVVDVWLASGMPNLTGGAIGVLIYATAQGK